MRAITVQFKDSYLPTKGGPVVRVEIDATVDLGDDMDEHFCDEICGLIWDESKDFRFQMMPLDLNEVSLAQLDDWRARACEIAHYEQYNEETM